MTIFADLKVLDLTKVYSGPLATRYLADYGATVIKIENPLEPDPSRNFPPLKNGVSGYYEILNRGKVGLNLNLKSKSGLSKFYSLVKTADVVVENMSPNAKFNLKIDYEVLKKINPKIIYASLSGKDQKSNDRYFDIIAQAESGLMSLTGTPATFTKVGPAVIDAFGGMNLAFAISSALYYREKTGMGQNIQVSMLASSVNMLEQNIIEASITHNNPVRQGNHDNAISPFGVFKTKDGSIALAIGSERLWTKFIETFPNTNIENPSYATNKLRLKNQSELIKDIENIFKNFNTNNLITKLTNNGLPTAKVSEMTDVLINNWFFDNNALVKYKHLKLGNIVVPGRPIIFSVNNNNIDFTESPQTTDHE